MTNTTDPQLTLGKNPDMERIEKYIATVRWQFAKSMPKCPHWYTLNKWTLHLSDDFFHFVVYIRNHGYEEKFYSRKLIYLNIGEYKYWTMGSPLWDTILINRALIQNVYTQRKS